MDVTFINQFNQTVRTRMESGDERIGQAMFNTLAEMEPDLANMLRGSLADPFYAERPYDSRICKFLDLVFGGQSFSVER